MSITEYTRKLKITNVIHGKSMTSSEPKLSIIVVNYKTEDLLWKNFITEKGLTNNNLEWIIVSNSRKSKLLEKLEKINNVHIIYPEKNLGYGKACNLGAKKAKADVLVIANPDIVFKKKWINQTLKSFLEKKADVLGPLITKPQGEIDWPCCRPFPSPLNFVLNTVWSRNQLKQWKSKKLIEKKQCPCLSGALFLIQKEVYKKINGFDEKIFMYGEDLDFFWRLRKENFRIIFDPKIKVIHLGGRSSEQLPDKGSLLALQGSSDFFYKYYPNWLINFSIKILGILLLIKYGIIKTTKNQKKLTILRKMINFCLKSTNIND